MNRYCWHSWAKWETTSELKLKRTGTVVGRALIQQRHCTKCGKVLIRKTQTELVVSIADLDNEGEGC